MRIHRALLIAALFLLTHCGGCSCGGGGLGSLIDAKPASLGPDGILVEQPKPNEALTGTWVSVTGWLDPSRYDFVLVDSSGQTPDFLAPTGHVGLPTVPVILRTDGRFIAPRVPLQDGPNTVTVFGFLQGAIAKTIELSVTATQTNQVPVTLVATPESGPPPLAVKLAAYAASSVPGWQWDFDGDGVFDVQETSPSYVYDAGQYVVLARTKLGADWVYSVGGVIASPPGQVTHSATIGSPRAVVTAPMLGVLAPQDEFAATRYVLVAEESQVDVFDAQLHPLATLTGLNQPTGMSVDDQGRIYVADTGNNRIVRYLPSGDVDTTWADGGSFTGPPGDALSRPGSLSLEMDSQTLSDGGVAYPGTWEMVVLEQGGRRLAFTDFSSWQSTTSPFGLADDAGIAPNDFVRAWGPAGDPSNEYWFSVDGGLFMPDVSDPQPAPQPPVMRAYAPASNSLTPYWAALDGSGTLHEWFVDRAHHRTSTLDFASATALAVDYGGTAFQDHARRAQGDLGVPTFGPVVLLIAGPGHLERVVVPVFQGRPP